MKLANDTCNLNSNGKPDSNAKRGLIQDFPLEEKSTRMAKFISFKIICYLKNWEFGIFPSKSNPDLVFC